MFTPWRWEMGDGFSHFIFSSLDACRLRNVSLLRRQLLTTDCGCCISQTYVKISVHKTIIKVFSSTAVSITEPMIKVPAFSQFSQANFNPLAY
jgi:hypothetical protein